MKKIEDYLHAQQEAFMSGNLAKIVESFEMPVAVVNRDSRKVAATPAEAIAIIGAAREGLNTAGVSRTEREITSIQQVGNRFWFASAHDRNFDADDREMEGTRISHALLVEGASVRTTVLIIDEHLTPKEAIDAAWDGK